MHSRYKYITIVYILGSPVVRFIAGMSSTIKQEKWVVKNAQGGLFIRKQLPLKLAWAFSIHKSQVCTLNCYNDNNFYTVGKLFLDIIFFYNGKNGKEPCAEISTKINFQQLSVNNYDYYKFNL